MKKIYLLTKVCFFAAMMFFAAACTEDDAVVTPIFPEGETVETVVPGTEYTLTFSANMDWELRSSALWCLFSNGFQKIKGEAGEVSQKITINTDAMTLDDAVAEITLVMGSEEKVIARYTREGLVPQVTDSEGKVYGEGTLLTFEYSNNGVTAVFSFNANYEWSFSDEDIPEWVKIDEGSEIGGKAGDMVQVSFSVPETYWLEAQSGNFIIKNDEIGSKVTIPVSFEGMPEGVVKVKGLSSVWNWVISQDGKQYWQNSQGSMEEEVQKYDLPVTLKVTAKNNDYVVKCLYDASGWMTSVDDGMSGDNFYFYKVDDDEKGNVTIGGFSSLEGSKRKGYVIVLPTSVYNELSNNGQWLDDKYLVNNSGDVASEVEKYVVMAFEQEAPVVEKEVELKVYSVTGSDDNKVQTPVTVEFGCGSQEVQTVVDAKISSGEIYLMDKTQIYNATVKSGSSLDIYPLLKDDWGDLVFGNCTFMDLQGNTLGTQPTYETIQAEPLSDTYINFTCNESVIVLFKCESFMGRKLLVINAIKSENE